MQKTELRSTHSIEEALSDRKPAQPRVNQSQFFPIPYENHEDDHKLSISTAIHHSLLLSARGELNLDFRQVLAVNQYHLPDNLHHSQFLSYQPYLASLSYPLLSHPAEHSSLKARSSISQSLGYSHDSIPYSTVLTRHHVSRSRTSNPNILFTIPLLQFFA